MDLTEGKGKAKLIDSHFSEEVSTTGLSEGRAIQPWNHQGTELSSGSAGGLVQTSYSNAVTSRPDYPSPSSGFFHASKGVMITGANFNETHGNQFNINVTLNASQEEPKLSPSSHPGISTPDPQVSVSTPTPMHLVSNEHVNMTTTAYSPDNSNKIYERHLELKKRGFPLWIPEPNKRLPLHYRRIGVSIGDVGIITPSGGFSFIFNICRSHNDPINPRTLPEGFTPIYPPLDSTDVIEFPQFKEDSYLASTTIEKVQNNPPSIKGLTFETSATDGAILALPEGAIALDLENIPKFRKYAATHMESWYRYINGPRGREAKNGEVRLVIGCDKTPSWGMVAVANISHHKKHHLTFKPVELGEGSSAGPLQRYRCDYTGLGEARVGPDLREINELKRNDDSDTAIEGRYWNQCTFMRTLNITLNDDVFQSVSRDVEAGLIEQHRQFENILNTTTSGSGHSTSSAQAGRNIGGTPTGFSEMNWNRLNIDPARLKEQGTISSTPSAPKFHPADTLNRELLLRAPNCRAAMTKDEDWFSVISDDDSIMPSAEELVGRVLAAHHITEEDGVVYLEPREEHLCNIRRRKTFSSSAINDSNTGRQSDLIWQPNENEEQISVVTQEQIHGPDLESQQSAMTSTHTGVSAKKDGMIYEHEFDITVIKSEVAPTSTKLPARYPRTYIAVTCNGVTKKTDINKNGLPGKTTHWNKTFSFSCQGSRNLDAAFTITLYKTTHSDKVTNTPTVETEAKVDETTDLLEKNKAIRREFPNKSSIEFRITSRKIRNISMFAVLIGIDKYKSDEIPNLSGCVNDAKDMEELLKADLHVPYSSIHSLHDTAATRKNIIQAIQTHLINNKRINPERNNSMIIFFAGHGSRAVAPRGWPATPDGKIEVICPHDQMASDGKGGLISAIPDRTINSLIRQLANARGNNITLILDSSHSEGAGRNSILPPGYTKRSLDFLPVIPSDIDRDIWHAHTTSAGFKHEGMVSSVLLAACAHEEQAHEFHLGKKMRGVFTSLLVTEVRQSIQRSTSISYFELIKSLHPHITHQVSQTPQCAGGYKHSLLFTLTPSSPAPEFFKLRSLRSSDNAGNNVWEVDRGAIDGVVSGTVFRVRTEVGLVAKHGTLSRSLVAAIVFPLKSFLRPVPNPGEAEPIGDLVDGAEVFIWNWKNERMILKVYSDIQDLDILKKIDTPTTRLVKTISQAHISISLDAGNQLVIRRLVGYLSDFHDVKGITDNICPEDLPRHSRLPQVLDAINFFRYHLNVQHRFGFAKDHGPQPILSTGTPQPQAGLVEMHLYRLIQEPKWYGPLIPQTPLQDVFSDEHVATLTSKEVAYEDSLFGIEIKNGSSQDLFVYLYYFDPISYCVQAWYNPPNESSVLKQGETLTIGYGAHGGYAFHFSLAPEEEESTGFVKLYLSNRYVDMNFLDQDTPFSELPERRNVASRPHMVEAVMFASMVARIDVVQDLNVQTVGVGPAISSESPRHRIPTVGRRIPTRKLPFAGHPVRSVKRARYVWRPPNSIPLVGL